MSQQIKSECHTEIKKHNILKQGIQQIQQLNTNVRSLLSETADYAKLVFKLMTSYALKL